MSRIVERDTIVTPKFQAPPLPAFTTRAVVCSILAWIGLAVSAQYFLKRLQDPCQTFQLLEQPVKTGGLFNRHYTSTCLQGSHTWSAQTACLLPGFLYDESEYEYKLCPDESKSAIWTLLPFKAALWVALLSATFELYLMIGLGRPFRVDISAFTTSVKDFRNMMFALVEVAAINATLVATIGPENAILDYALLSGAFFGFGAMSPFLYFGREWIEPYLLAGIEGMVLSIVRSRGNVDSSVLTATVLSLACVLRIAAILFTRETPSGSATSTTLYTLSFLCLYWAIGLVGNYDPSFPISFQEYTFPEAYNKLVWVLLVLTILCGFCCTMFLFKKTFQACRSMISYFVWSLVYTGFLAEPLLLFNPYKLSQVYQLIPPHKIRIHPYTQEHIWGMPKVLAIPSIANNALPQTAAIFTQVRAIMTYGFDIITFIDVVFPQAVVATPVDQKERFALWETGHRYYPSTLFLSQPKFPVLGSTLQDAPAPMVESYKTGDILPYLCQFGYGARFLKRARATEVFPFYDSESSEGKEGDFLVVDFRYMEHYDNKPDYEPYGGVALFKIDSLPTGNKLKVVWVVGPRTRQRIYLDINNGTYRRIEAMITATIYFAVVAGKHLAEIHMTYNLLEVALHNAFDYDLNTNPRDELNAHPFRLVLYIHLFSHSLAAELTVRHLIQDGAVFNQIFALDYDSLLNFMQQTYNSFEYACDEDFEAREKTNEKLRERSPSAGSPDRSALSLDFNCSLDWELSYRDIFVRYADSMVDAIYYSDQHVKDDDALQEFFATILTLFNTVPDRYEAFQSKAGVSRFLSDTINHLVIGHQFYGTTGVSGATDPRIILTQVPKDGGPTGVDEWRSLAFVALATAYVDFCPLLQDPGNAIPNRKRELESVFDDATPVKLDGARVDNTDSTRNLLQSRMKDAFAVMQTDLRLLNNQWEYTGAGKNSEADINYKYLRPLPKDLTTGPGY